ncbi:hypothetical protein R1flu_001110 [Riccia fluitans]|uniref:RING-type domain-containing protein n=1 Tax=Riccia fluitans TaxID=41844 RepID=A0ABD1Y2E5_9MARC
MSVKQRLGHRIIPREIILPEQVQHGWPIDHRRREVVMSGEESHVLPPDSNGWCSGDELGQQVSRPWHSAGNSNEDIHRPWRQQQRRTRTSNAREPATGDNVHAELESQARNFLRLIDQSRRTSEGRESVCKKAKIQADILYQQRLNSEQQVMKLQEEKEKLAVEVASLRTEVASSRADIDREKKNTSTWRDRHMILEGEIVQLKGSIEQLNDLRTEKDQLTNELEKQRAEYQNERGKTVQMQERISTLENTLKTLQINHSSISHDLQVEKDKALCQICMDRQRDICSLPCLHLDYCSVCLLQHLQKNKSCPTCRTPVSGTLQTSLLKL